jgi:hypothetical protein
LSVGALIELCQLAGFNVIASKREDITSFVRLLEASSDNIKGAYYCLERKEITPVANIPANLKRGWDFALWYAFASAAKEEVASDYIAIKRETSLVSTTGANWNPVRQFPDLSRLSSLIRLIAKSLSNKVVSPKKFLKGEGYFLEKFVGKKPMPGLFTNDEFAEVLEVWGSKQKFVKDRYSSIPDTFQRLPPRGLGAYIGGFNNANPAIITAIEGAKASRIPMLLVTTGRGRSAARVIAKGSTLPEKLRSIDGGDSVRTIGRVLYSPLTGVSQNEFVSMAIRAAVQMHSKGSNVTDIADNFMVLASTDTNVDLTQRKRLWSSVELAAQTYLEVVPDRAGFPAWDAIFAPQQG